MRRALLLVASLCALVASFGVQGCSQTPIVVPLRSMERPKDVDFVCLKHVDATTWRGVPLARCHVLDATDPNNPTGPDPLGDDGRHLDPSVEYRLHAVVTQLARGELAVVDLGQGPNDPGATLLKVDPRLPGYSFLPVGAVPQDVVADPRGKAVYVASGHDRRIDVIPAEILRGPVETTIESLGRALPWPNIPLGVEDGAPTRMTAYDDWDGVLDATTPANDHLHGSHDRLYVVLPEAKGGPKIAVFDIGCYDPTANPDDECPSALLPHRLGDITLTVDKPTPVVPTALHCGSSADPWWISFEQACYPPELLSKPTTPKPEVVPPVQPHLGGIAVANGLLFAADDGAPFVHVFDIDQGHHAELARIALGSKTSRIALSEPVADEVTFQNGNAIMTCEANHWVGDGVTHTDTESAAVAKALGGVCRAHRYLYAVDYDDSVLGNGSIAVVDLPVKLTRDPADATRIVGETIDFASLSLEQPMGCDAPALPATRITLGSAGVGGSYAVPARAITFVHYDPRSPRGALMGQRCRSWGTTDKIPEDAFPQKSPTGSGAELEGVTTDPNQHPNKFDLQDAQNSWSGTVDPRQLRGTFAFVALDNGWLGVVDIDDYDSLCRGPSTASDAAAATLQFPTSTAAPFSDTLRASGEYAYVVRRHHPRAQRFFNADNIPSISSILLLNGPTNGASALSWGSQTQDQRARPHLFPLAYSSTVPTSPSSGDYIKTSADNPYGYVPETWTITFQGVIPGFGGGGVSIDENALVFRDPGGAFCARGVEAFDVDPFAHNDLLQIVDDVCDDPNAPAASSHTRCDSKATHDACLAKFAASTDDPLLTRAWIRRDFVIKKALGQHVEIAKYFELDDKTGVATLQDATTTQLTELKSCFPGLVRYVVRTRDTWLVNGSASGFLHRIVIDPKVKLPDGTADPDAPCTIDPSRPLVFQGRVHEIPGTATGSFDPADASKLVINLTDKKQVCPNTGAPSVFVNPFWSFAMQQGYDPSARVPVASTRDFTFAFRALYNFLPLTQQGGAMPTSIRTLQIWKNHQDILNWEMISLVDSIDKGLGVFFVYDFTTSKVFE